MAISTEEFNRLQMDMVELQYKMAAKFIFKSQGVIPGEKHLPVKILHSCTVFATLQRKFAKWTRRNF
jgi:hypothetical protein